MAKLLETLIPLVSSLALLFMMVNSQTTSFYHDSFVPDPTDLTYQGDAFVPSGSSFLRLTKTDASGTPQSSSAGRVVYSPVPFWRPGAQADFETTIKFSITPTDDNPADGIAFFFSPVGSPIPSDANGGGLGIFNSTGTGTSLFAIEFDVYRNGWDPSYRHIGVDINSIQSKKTVEFDDSLLGKEVTAIIQYVQATKTITVKVQSAGEEMKQVLSYESDLSQILQQEVQVGISASTGLYVALHDLHAWYFTSTMLNTVATNGAGIREVV